MNVIPLSRVDQVDASADVTVSDEQILEGVQRREGQALETLYRRHATALRGVIRRVLPGFADADDILQEVFVEIWARADTYSPSKGRPLGWMNTIARRRAIDRVRQMQTYRRITEEAGSEINHVRLSSGGMNLEKAVDSKDFCAVLGTILNRLPAAQRQALELAFFKDMSQREIAAKIGVPVGTVKTRLQLALAKLERALKGVSGEMLSAYRRPSMAA